MNGFVGCAWIVLVGAVSMGAAATDGLVGVAVVTVGAAAATAAWLYGIQPALTRILGFDLTRGVHGVRSLSSRPLRKVRGWL